MSYNFNDIEKIIEFTSWTDKEKKDELLRIDCSMYTYLGKDSSKQELERVKKNSRVIYRSLKTIDPNLSELLMNAIDK
jgi:hypothetical protein